MIVVRKSKVPFGRGGNPNEANGLRRAVAPNNSYLFLELLEELAGHDDATDSNHVDYESERGIKNASSGCMKHKIQGANLKRPILSMICANDGSAIWLFMRQTALQLILELPAPWAATLAVVSGMRRRTYSDIWLEAAKVRQRHGRRRRPSVAHTALRASTVPHLVITGPLEYGRKAPRNCAPVQKPRRDPLSTARSRQGPPVTARRFKNRAGTP